MLLGIIVITFTNGYEVAMMKIHRRLLALIMVALLVCSMALAGCGSERAADKPKVRIALCLFSLMEGVPDKLREKFPQVEFEFTLANNSMDYYEYLYRHNDLPDIITVRRFSLHDSLALKDTLVDLSKTDYAASYYQNYLQNYTYDDGTVNWLPSVAEVWCLVANKTLFEENGIALPHDYPSFIAACQAFEARGIKGFTTDWQYDYTALETLQGFNIDRLQSVAGKKWRMDYANGKATTSDEEVWKAALAHLDEVLIATGNKGVSAEDAKRLLEPTVDDVNEALLARKVAIIRSGGVDIIPLSDNSADEFVMLPYFGATENDNWLLTYPAYQAAINKNSQVDQKLLLEIFRFMMSKECVEVQGKGSNVLSYTSDVKIDNNKDLASLEPYIKANKLYIRIASNEFFAASKKAVQGLITGEYTVDEAYAVFEQGLNTAKSAVKYDVNIEKAYPYAFDEQHGSRAASALLNSCREVWGVDMAVSYPISFSNSVYKGELATSQVKYLVAGNYGTNFYLTLTGAQIKDLVSAMLSYEPKANGRDGGMLPKTKNLLPVTSGFAITVSRAAGAELYTLDSVTVGGQEIDPAATYSFIYSVPRHYASFIAKQAGIDLPKGSDKKLPSVIKTLQQYLVTDGRQLQAPTDYITVKE